MALASSPSFLVKDERKGHHLQAVVIVAWNKNDIAHPFCPVTVLWKHLPTSCEARPDHLFIWPCSNHGIVVFLCEVTEVDPGKSPQSQDIRKFSTLMAFFSLFSPKCYARNRSV